MEWQHTSLDQLWFTPYGQPKRLITRNGAGAGNAANRVSRIPSGHPEGYLEGFANIYSEASEAIFALRDGNKPSPEVTYPGITEGIAGLAFIEAAVQSSQTQSWVALDC